MAFEVVEENSTNNSILAYCSRSSRFSGWFLQNPWRSLKRILLYAYSLLDDYVFSCKKLFSFKITFTNCPKLSNWVELKGISRKINTTVAALLNYFIQSVFLWIGTLSITMYLLFNYCCWYKISTAFAMKL